MLRERTNEERNQTETKDHVTAAGQKLRAMTARRAKSGALPAVTARTVRAMRITPAVTRLSANVSAREGAEHEGRDANVAGNRTAGRKEARAPTAPARPPALRRRQPCPRAGRSGTAVAVSAAASASGGTSRGVRGVPPSGRPLGRPHRAGARRSRRRAHRRGPARSTRPPIGKSANSELREQRADGVPSPPTGTNPRCLDDGHVVAPLRGDEPDAQAPSAARGTARAKKAQIGSQQGFEGPSSGDDAIARGDTSVWVPRCGHFGLDFGSWAACRPRSPNRVVRALFAPQGLDPE